jgi:hypothetical protein
MPAVDFFELCRIRYVLGRENQAVHFPLKATSFVAFSALKSTEANISLFDPIAVGMTMSLLKLRVPIIEIGL